MATEHLYDDAPSGIDKWVNAFETDDYPSGRSRVGAKWYVKDVRGGRKTIARETQSKYGTWQKPKTLTSGEIAKIGINEWDDRAYLFIYDGGHLQVYGGNMKSLGYISVSGTHDFDKYGFMENVAAFAPEPQKKKPPVAKKQSGNATFLGTRRSGDNLRVYVQGTKFGEWGVYRNMDGYYKNFYLVHIPTGIAIKSDESRKILLFKAIRLDRFVPKIGERELTEEERRLVREVSSEYMPRDRLRNNGLPKDDVSLPSDPKARVTQREEADGDRAKKLRDWLNKLRYLTPPLSDVHNTLVASLLRAYHMLVTGVNVDSNTTVTAVQMQAIRRIADDKTHEWNILARKLIAKRLPDGKNRGDFVSVRLDMSSIRGVVLRAEMGLVEVSVDVFGKTYNVTLEESRVESKDRHGPKEYIVQALKGSSITSGKLVRTVDTYKRTILDALAESDNVLLENSMDGINIHDLAKRALGELTEEGMITVGEYSEGRPAHLTTKARAVELPLRVITWLRQTIPMLPKSRAGLLTSRDIARKFKDESRDALTVAMRYLANKGDVRIQNNGPDAPYYALGDGTPVEPSKPIVKHMHRDGDSVYADTWSLNSVREFYPEAQVKHMGFGEFYVQTPLGRIDFDRSRGKDFSGQSGRSHKLSGEPEEALTDFVHRLERHLAKLEPKPALTDQLKPVKTVEPNLRERALPEGFDGFEDEETREVDPSITAYKAVVKLKYDDRFYVGRTKSKVFRVLDSKAGAATKMCLLDSSAGRNTYELVMPDYEEDYFEVYKIKGDGSGTRLSDTPSSSGSLTVLPSASQERSLFEWVGGDAVKEMIPRVAELFDLA